MSMKKLGLLVQIVTLLALVAIATIGCSEDTETKPKIARLQISESCGVAPLRVDFRADATGGAAQDQATGGNNWLTMHWDFGDSTQITNGTSIAYHTYEDPGLYTAVVTAEDKNGERASRSVMIEVKADSLTINPYTVVGMDTTDTVLPCRPIEFGIKGNLCNFDAEEGNYERFVFDWTVNDSSYGGTNPLHSYQPDEEGENYTRLHLYFPDYSTTRVETVVVNVLPNAGSALSLNSDWLLTPQPTDQDTLFRDYELIDGIFPDDLIHTTVLTNNGPADAYNLRIFGDFPPDSEIEFLGQTETHGLFMWNADNRSWTLDIPYLASGDEVTVDVSFRVNIANRDQAFDFPDTLTQYPSGLPYPCDNDQDDNTTGSVLVIRQVPSDLGIETNWGDLSSDPEYDHAVTAWPDTVMYTVAVVNDGPSGANDVMVIGDIPDTDRIEVLGTSTSFGTIEYDEDTNQWNWEMNVGRSGRAVARITLAISSVAAGTSFDFPSEIQPYADDSSPDNNDITAVLNITSVP